jgi:Holliday junction resolvasome RuvABC endonuclease subunit
VKTSVEVGIDYSLNHTSVNILYDNEILYYSIDRNKGYTKFQNKLVEELKKFKNYKHYSLGPIETSTDYSLSELNKVKSANIIIDNILDILKDFEINKIGIEGISFASKGATSKDIAGHHYILRKELMKLTENIQIISPMSVKKTAGKGNYKKREMLEAYLSNTSRDPILKECDIYKYILLNKDYFIKKDNVVEPVCGVIDSYWVRRSINI